MTQDSRHAAVRWLPIAILLSLAGALYFWKLSTAPVYLGGDEARFGSQAYSIATTGRDLSGRFMPLFIWLDDLNWWYQPTLFYLIAVTLKVFPLTEGTIRIPTAVIGLLDIVLLGIVVRKLMPGRGYALIGAAILALTPAHFIFSREARDFICLLPFVLGWLWCFLTLMETNASSRCHRPSGRGRPRLSLRAMIVPNFKAQRRTVS